MAQKRKGERLLGPYRHGRGWRVVQVAADGSRRRRSFATEKKAEKFIEILTQQVAAADHTTESALELYMEHLEAKGNKPGSIKRTTWSIRKLFPAPVPLWSLRPGKLKESYKKLSATLSVDSHRNALAETKTFLGWCVAEGLLSSNPAEKLKGIGRRNKRKAQLRFREARSWYRLALAEADDGNDGSLAALMALLLGMRASEITGVRVRDLDEDEEPFDTLWIPDAKTEAGRRTLEVPEVLRPLLAERARGRRPDALLFRARDGRRHWRAWPRGNVRRLCEAAGVPTVTAHGMRGLLATLTLDRGTAGAIVAAQLGHEEERTSQDSYAVPGAAAAGARRKGLRKLETVPRQAGGPTKKTGSEGT